MMTILRRISRLKKAARLADLTVTVYTRTQCCCCHKAVEVLESYQREYGFQIEQVDIDSDPALAEQYGLSIPVVAVGGKVRFKGLVNPVLFERLLKAEAKRIETKLS
jgi:predicted thioredoxin/glutaredoxin